MLVTIPYMDGMGYVKRSGYIFFDSLLSSLPEVHLHVLFLKPCHSPSLLNFNFHFEWLNSIGSVLVSWFMNTRQNIHYQHVFKKSLNYTLAHDGTNNTIIVNLHWQIYIIYIPLQSTIFSSPTTLASHDGPTRLVGLCLALSNSPPGGLTPSDLQQISANGIIIIATPQVQREMFNTALQRAAWKTMVQNIKKNASEDRRNTRTREMSMKDGVLGG